MVKRAILALSVAACLVVLVGTGIVKPAHAHALTSQTSTSQASPSTFCRGQIDPITLEQLRAGVSSKIHDVKCMTLTAGAVTPQFASNMVIVFCLDATFQNCNFELDGAACSSTQYYQEPSMPTGWDNVVSGYHTGNNCYTAALFDDPNYAVNNPDGNGAEYTSYPGTSHDVSYIGPAMNDRTSSWRLADTCTHMSSCLYLP